MKEKVRSLMNILCYINVVVVINIIILLLRVMMSCAVQFSSFIGYTLPIPTRVLEYDSQIKVIGNRLWIMVKLTSVRY